MHQQHFAVMPGRRCATNMHEDAEAQILANRPRQISSNRAQIDPPDARPGRRLLAAAGTKADCDWLKSTTTLGRVAKHQLHPPCLSLKRKSHRRSFIYCSGHVSSMMIVLEIRTCWIKPVRCQSAMTDIEQSVSAALGPNSCGRGEKG